MAEELKTGEGCFNFMVQLQDTDKYMPIAKISIPIQEFDTVEQQAFCEDLSFSSWNSLDEHRPIGQMNRIRKEVYQASSNYRHKKNNTEVPTNLDW